MSGPFRLHTFYAARRQHLFRHHVRIGTSIFARPCSCTASLADDKPTRTQPLSDSTPSTPPKPPADHRELATAQGLFTTSTYSPGSPLLLPNGADMFIKLTSFLRSLYPQFGFREVITPTIYKQSLWERSGHWVNYAEDMFAVRGRGATGSTAGEAGEDEEFGLKPMNCPGHCLLFASEKRSYRDLPVRFADFSPLHRNEISGALSGLTRVRRFHQDDGHIFCRPAQIEAEIKRTMEFIQLVYSDVFDLGPYRLVLSTRPTDNFIGTIAEWDAAEAQLTRALDSTGREWTLNAGDGAFYGPKIDVILRDSDGKEHQTATIQLDFQLPQRFGLSYTAPAPELEAHGAVGPDTDPELLATSGSVTPVIIHRAVLGSLERFLALLIEHYNGRYPLWLSPRPMIFLTVGQSEAELAALQRVVEQVPGNAPFADVGRRGEALLHVETDTSARGLGKKVHEAKAAGYNIIGVVGPRDAVKGTVSLEVGGRNAEVVREVLAGVEGAEAVRNGVRMPVNGLTRGLVEVVARYL